MWYNKVILIVLSLNAIIKTYNNCIKTHEFDNAAKKLGGVIGSLLAIAIDVYIIITLFNLWW